GSPTEKRDHHGLVDGREAQDVSKRSSPGMRGNDSTVGREGRDGMGRSSSAGIKRNDSLSTREEREGVGRSGSGMQSHDLTALSMREGLTREARDGMGRGSPTEKRDHHGLVDGIAAQDVSGRSSPAGSGGKRSQSLDPTVVGDGCDGRKSGGPSPRLKPRLRIEI
ncbi:hypothetical protein BC829DRAFT_395524, partial [Chytridium lagenaria]